MLIRLSNNCHARQYGPFSHIFNHVNKVDITFKDAEPYFKVLTHEPVDFDEVISRITALYEDVQREVVERDLKRLIQLLSKDGFVVEGAAQAELARKDVGFTYNVEMPSTAPDVAPISEVEGHRELHAYFEKHPTPFSLHFDLTSLCNEKCVHCYVPRDKHFFIDAKKCMEVMDQFREMEGMQVTLSGGECLLHPDFESIIRHARKCDFSISVLSNLTLLDMYKAELLKEMNVSLVQVSLYSMNPEVHDAITQLPRSFSKSKASIELLHSMDVPLQISCPTMKANYRGYKKVLEYAASLKIKAYTDFIMMARSDHTTDNLDNRLSLQETEEIIRTIAENEPEFKSALKEDRPNPETPEERAERPICGVCIDAICLNADGNYYPCSGFQDYPLGNCYKQTLREVWEESPKTLYLRGLRGKDIPECIHCVDRAYCSTCLVRNFNETSDMLKVSKHFCHVAHLNHVIVDEFRKKQGGFCNGCK